MTGAPMQAPTTPPPAGDELIDNSGGSLDPDYDDSLLCGPGCNPCGNFCGPPGCVWVAPEYLYWWTEGMHVPALVTTGPSTAQPGFLDDSTTIILFGNSIVNSKGRSGGRISGGTWLDSCQTIGIEGDYFALASVSTNYFASSTGDPILSRPFFDTNPAKAEQNVEQVASPGSIEGSVSVSAPTQFMGAGLGMRFNLCCGTQCFECDCLPSFNGPSYWRLDFLLGYRYARLGDGVNVNENLVSVVPTLPGQFLVNDSFRTVNQFNGVEFGTAAFKSRGRWSLEWITKLGMGFTNEFASINGSTVTTQNGVSTTSEGGLLAQTTNIGNYRRSEFAVLPQIFANLGYQITPGIRFIVGYSFIYWSRVARAGDQIDTDVNSTLLPNSPTPPTGDLRHPQFVFRDTDFWAQGINVGLDMRW